MLLDRRLIENFDWRFFTIVLCLLGIGLLSIYSITYHQASRGYAAVYLKQLYWICIGWGIGMGYHRLHTHRSYKVPKWLDYLFAVCGSMTLQGGPISWVATHRIHHQLSDKEGDPHSPRDGKWWFLKLLGDAPAVASAREAFVTFATKAP